MTPHVLILCYHAVSERWPCDLAVTPEQLERQLRIVMGRGYRGTRFHEAVTSPPHARTVAVTFDDAYRSVLELAFPILSSLGLPGTVFVPTSFPGAETPMAWPGIDHWLGGPYEGELEPMSWDELRRVAAAGWEVGSHTRSHPRLPGLADAALADELRGSRADCEHRLETECRSLAYPYSDADPRVAEAARAAGYEAGAAIRPRLDPRPRLAWPRVAVYRGEPDWRFRLKVAPAVRRLRTSRAWPAVKRVLG